MISKNIFKGFGVAIVTPFQTDGTPDYEALGKLVNEQIEGGADFLCVLGTTAETPCLTAEEKRNIVSYVHKTNAGRVPLLLGAGGNCTANVIDGLRDIEREGLVDGVLIVCPYYNKPTAEGLYRHFKAVADSTKLPVVLYNVPGRTGVNLTPATALRIAKDCPNVVAVKEASGNVAQGEEIIKNAPEGFEVLCGDDGIAADLLERGATGVISVVGNALPALFAQLTHAALQGDRDTAHALQSELAEMCRLMMAEGNPGGIKALLALQGKAENVLRLPLVSVSQETNEKIKQELERIEKVF